MAYAASNSVVQRYSTSIGTVTLTQGWYNATTQAGFGLKKIVNKHGFLQGSMQVMQDTLTRPGHVYPVETATGNPDGWEFYSSTRDSLNGKVYTMVVVVTLDKFINTAYFRLGTGIVDAPYGINTGFYKYLS